MKKHEILSSQARAALFDPPTDPAAIVPALHFLARGHGADPPAAAAPPIGSGSPSISPIGFQAARRGPRKLPPLIRSR
jgi:hypothetical protein